MAENGNRQWTVWMAGIIATMLTSAMFFMGTSVVANDKDSRGRDTRIEACYNEKISVLTEKLSQSILDQQQTNQQILIALEGIKTDLHYLKKVAQ